MLGVGYKIKEFRCMRGLSQKELGVAVGFDESSAGVRIAQYESGVRTPKKELLTKIAEVLNVDVNALSFPIDMNEEQFKYLLFWLEECGLAAPMAASYDTSDIVPVPRDITVGFSTLDETLAEWVEKGKAYRNGEISEEEYMEWKYNIEDTKSV